jgi:adenylate cyclase
MSPPLEIERTYLLSGMPPIPPGAEIWMIAQGYLVPGAAEVEGRIRRIVRPDGRTSFFHTIKSGTGLVRTEEEREIAREAFDRLWPSTAGRRLSKTRHRVESGGFTWEIDQFHGIELVLAEVELPDADAEAPIPDWLAPHVVRDVTEEPQYRNYEIAGRSGLLESAAKAPVDAPTD